ncbi:hypothetical protein DFH27DRAFT_530688 [Peziza echinospora]|nr:hypothetical protein DFH27DRAFT_530688 [Peziza echinospora]
MRCEISLSLLLLGNVCKLGMWWCWCILQLSGTWNMCMCVPPAAHAPLVLGCGGDCMYGSGRTSDSTHPGFFLGNCNWFE